MVFKCIIISFTLYPMVVSQTKGLIQAATLKNREFDIVLRLLYRLYRLLYRWIIMQSNNNANDK